MLCRVLGVHFFLALSGTSSRVGTMCMVLAHLHSAGGCRTATSRVQAAVFTVRVNSSAERRERFTVVVQ
jgi:hypothetical protein